MLQFENLHEGISEDYIEKLEMPYETLSVLQKDEKIPEIYANNQSVLTLNSSEAAEERLSKL